MKEKYQGNSSIIEKFFGRDISEFNTKKLENIKEEIAKGKVTWVLGTGVSVPAKLPQWKELLTRMWIRVCELDSGKTEENYAQWYATARRTILNSNKKIDVYNGKVNETIQGNAPDFLNGLNVLESAEYIYNFFMDFVADESFGKSWSGMPDLIMKELTRECLEVSLSVSDLKKALETEVLGKLSAYLAAEGTQRVITYNYDNLLEFCLSEFTDIEESSLNIFYDKSKNKSEKEDCVNIYHPHGYLPIVDVYGKKGGESERIILTESSYYQMEEKVYNWENSIQAKSLVESSCVFIGFSGDDYNFRRIIKNLETDANGDEPRHYIFFCINKVIDLVYGKSAKDYARDKWMSEEKAFEAIRNSDEYAFEKVQLINRLYAQEMYWRKHGIIPIWTTYKELPDMIECITRRD